MFYVCLFICVWKHVCYRTRVVRRQLAKVGFILLPCLFWGSNLGSLISKHSFPLSYSTGTISLFESPEKAWCCSQGPEAVSLLLSRRCLNDRPIACETLLHSPRAWDLARHPPLFVPVLPSPPLAPVFCPYPFVCFRRKVMGVHAMRPAVTCCHIISEQQNHKSSTQHWLTCSAPHPHPWPGPSSAFLSVYRIEHNKPHWRTVPRHPFSTPFPETQARFIF